MRHFSPIALLALASLAACGAPPAGPDLPVPSRSETILNVHLRVPEKATVTQEVEQEPLLVSGRIHGAAKMADGSLHPYSLHYSLYRIGEGSYPASYLIDMPKGSCNSGDCAPYVNERTVVDATEVVTQRWPDANGAAFAARIWVRDNRLLKLTWSEPGGIADGFNAAIAETVTLDRMPPDPAPSGVPPKKPDVPSTAPAPASDAPSSAS